MQAQGAHFKRQKMKNTLTPQKRTQKNRREQRTKKNKIKNHSLRTQIKFFDQKKE